MTKHFKLTAPLAIAALTLSASITMAADMKWDMPMAYSASNYHSENGAQFAREVTEASGGKLEVVAHPGGSLFKGGEIFRAVRTGQAPIGERLISALGNEDPLFEIDSLPFLATSFAGARKLYDATKPELQKVLASKGLTLLYTVPWPPQGLYAKKEVSSTADMKGVTFRAYNAATSRLAELMGAVPTKIEAAELSQAFATGAVEAMISSGSTGYDRKLWEHTSHWYNIQAWLPKNMVIVNNDAWAKLDEATQKVVLEKAAAAEARGWAKAEELANWYVEELAKEGMKVGPAGDQLKADFATIGETMTTEWLAKAGATGKAAVDAYKAK
jgi:TRAP-type C4-dicarboxylate transport system substrate-binding protein